LSYEQPVSYYSDHYTVVVSLVWYIKKTWLIRVLLFLEIVLNCIVNFLLESFGQESYYTGCTEWFQFKINWSGVICSVIGLHWACYLFDAVDSIVFLWHCWINCAGNWEKRKQFFNTIVGISEKMHVQELLMESNIIWFQYFFLME